MSDATTEATDEEPQTTDSAPERRTLGVPAESAPGDKRVAVSPESIPRLQKLGFDVVVEAGAGKDAGYADQDYVDAGAEIAAPESYREGGHGAWSCDVVVRIGAPTEEEAARLKPGAVFCAMLHPADNAERIEQLAKANVSAIALDRIPRISRAQKMDVLSSMANIAGYRAVLEAAVTYDGFFTAQVTAAGTLPPARVLVIGAGVAGLQAIAAARSLGAEVRAFDVRPATKEQVESLGGTFLMLDFDESGEGEGGYAKTMSKEFIEKEMELFAQQAKEVDVIITTALIPGRPAPELITTAMVESMKKGSVVVDLAAERGGNCQLTRPGEALVHEGVHVLGYTDLTSRFPGTSSLFFGGNIVALLSDMVTKEGEFVVDLEDEVVRGALVAHEGEVVPPPPRKPPPEKKAPPAPSQGEASPRAEKKPKKKDQSATIGGALALLSFAIVGAFAPASFVPHFTVFVLACFVGWQVVWSVTAALHTPLMSVTNAISGIILVGGMLQAGAETMTLAAILGAVALFFASINVAGGFIVTQRMLKMFRKDQG